MKLYQLTYFCFSYDFTKFNSLDRKMIEEASKMIGEEIPNLMKLMPAEDKDKDEDNDSGEKRRQAETAAPAQTRVQTQKYLRVARVEARHAEAMGAGGRGAPSGRPRGEAMRR